VYLKGIISLFLVGLLINPLSRQETITLADGLRVSLSHFLPHDLSLDQIASSRGIKSLRVHAYPEKAVNSLQGEQSVLIIVQDQRLSPVPNAQVSLVIRLPFGEESRFIIPSLTDVNGLSQFAFSYTSKEIGIVEIDVIVVHEKLMVKTSTSFRIWY